MSPNKQLRIRPKSKILNDTWFSIKRPRNSLGDVEVLLYGEIGMWGITALDFRAQLNDALSGGASRVVVHINSIGGDMFDSVAIYNMLRTCQKPVTTYVDSLAASGASLIAMAGSEVIMAEGSFMMIHNPQVMAIGDQHDIAETVDTVSLWAESCAKIYAAKTGIDLAAIQEMMDEETWMSADMALALGFCDKKDSASRVAACLGLNKYAKVPAELLGDLPVLLKEDGPVEIKENGTVEETEVLEQPVIEATPVIEVDQVAKAAEDTKAAMMANLEEIKALCKLAGKSGLALDYFSEGKSPDEVKELLLAAAVSTSAEVHVEIPNKEGAEKPRSNKQLDTNAVYRRWNSVKVRR